MLPITHKDWWSAKIPNIIIMMLMCLFVCKVSEEVQAESAWRLCQWDENAFGPVAKPSQEPLPSFHKCVLESFSDSSRLEVARGALMAEMQFCSIPILDKLALLSQLEIANSCNVDRLLKCWQVCSREISTHLG